VPWTKTGHVFSSESGPQWMVSHAQTPLALASARGASVRVWFGTRDRENRTVVGVLDADLHDRLSVKAVAETPALGLGRPGTFDDSGAMPSWIVEHGGRLLMYYTGWNRGSTVSYRNAIGVAASVDGGLTFTKEHEGPVLDRTPDEPFFCGTPCVLIDGGVWRMWYLSGVAWERRDGAWESRYDIRHAFSDDGVQWQRDAAVSVALAEYEAALARPTVLRRNDGYAMWYCVRGQRGDRYGRRTGYRIGYAESADGIVFNRMDDRSGIEVSATGWDSEMVAYPFVFEVDGVRHMLYNGNGFGRSGFGHARLDEATSG